MCFARNMLELPHMLFRNLSQYAKFTKDLKKIFSKYHLIVLSDIGIIKRLVNNAFFLYCNEQKLTTCLNVIGAVCFLIGAVCFLFFMTIYLYLYNV